MIGKQKDVKENAFSDKNVEIKYKSIEPIRLRDRSTEPGTLTGANGPADENQGRLNTIMKQLDIIND